MTDETLQWLNENDYDPSDLNLKGGYGNTALMKAAREGSASVVRDLLEAGADLSSKNVDGNTALGLSCFGENPDVVSLLIGAGNEIDT
ncbi:MAG: ankyrin repeat domain-containing protein, partial [Campylobacterales bacterium]